jgi:hypothetical protein
MHWNNQNKNFEFFLVIWRLVPAILYKNILQFTNQTADHFNGKLIVKKMLFINMMMTKNTI